MARGGWRLAVASAPLVHVCGESLRRICSADVVSERADERRGGKDMRGGWGGVAEVFTDGNRRRKAYTPMRNFTGLAVLWLGEKRGMREGSLGIK
jgi:hypothetical protein